MIEEIEDEVDDFVENPVIPADQHAIEVLQEVMRAKKGDPNKFASYWEMDEEDIDEATPDQIQNDPVQRTLWAAEHGKVDILKEMLENDNSLATCTDHDGYTPLHRAGYNGHLEAIKLLLKSGAEVEAQTEDGWTPLHSASNWGEAGSVGLLLSHGADINARTKGLQTPLHLAASNCDDRQTIELLLMNKRVDYTLKNKLGETARDLAVRNSKYHYLFEVADDAVNRLDPS